MVPGRSEVEVVVQVVPAHFPPNEPPIKAGPTGTEGGDL